MFGIVGYMFLFRYGKAKAAATSGRYHGQLIFGDI